VTVHRWSNLDIQFVGPKEAKIRAMLHNPMFLYGFPIFELFTVQGYYDHVLIKDDIDGRWRSKSLILDERVNWDHQIVAGIAILILLWRTRRIQ
jgi:hypothetical protein